jgi:hypothetical protein
MVNNSATVNRCYPCFLVRLYDILFHTNVHRIRELKIVIQPEIKVFLQKF